MVQKGKEDQPMAPQLEEMELELEGMMGEMRREGEKKLCLLTRLRKDLGERRGKRRRRQGRRFT